MIVTVLLHGTRTTVCCVMKILYSGGSHTVDMTVVLQASAWRLLSLKTSVFSVEKAFHGGEEEAGIGDTLVIGGRLVTRTTTTISENER